MSTAEALGLLAGNGILIRRPFVLAPTVALLGYDPAVWSATLVVCYWALGAMLQGRLSITAAWMVQAAALSTATSAQNGAGFGNGDLYFIISNLEN